MKCDTLNQKNVCVCASGQVYCLDAKSRKKDNYKSTTGAPQFLKSVKSVTQKNCEDSGQVMISTTFDLVFVRQVS